MKATFRKSFTPDLKKVKDQMVLDRGKAEQLLGWEPAITLRNGLREEWEWLSEHPGAWETYRI